MTMTVKGPGGVTVRFPDGTDAATIDKVMRQATGTTAAPATAPADTGGKGDFAGLAPGVTSANAPGSAPGQYNGLESALIGAGDMATFGGLDELGAGLKSAFGGQSYDDALKQLRGRRDEASAEHPVAYTAGQIAGGIPGALAVPEAALARGAGLGARVAAGAGVGAGMGAAYGYGSGEGGVENRLNSALRGGVSGGILGAAIPAVGNAIGKTLGKRAAMAAVPTVDDLKAQSQQLYASAQGSGARVAPQSFSDAVDQIAADAQTKGLDADIHPKSTAALNRLISEKGGSPDIQRLDTLRRVLKSAASSSEPAEQFQASRMVDGLDRYVNHLKPADMAAGSPRAAFDQMIEARRLWAMKAKGEALATMVDRAHTKAGQYTGSGFENALRAEFRQLALNAKRMRGFSGVEQEQIKAIARGGSMQNILRGIGKAAPTGIVSTALGSGAGFTAAGPVGAVAVPLVGALARKAATKMGMSKVAAFEAMVRNGGSRPFSTAVAQKAQTATTRALLPVGQGAVPFMLQSPLPNRGPR